MLPTGKAVPNYFSPYELRCHCGLPGCGAFPIDKKFLDKYNAFRHEWGKPIIVTSAERCVFWNAQVGGKKTSMHLVGRAIDAYVLADDQDAFVELAAKYGLVGVGRGTTFVHLDDSDARSWTYA